MTSRTSMPLPLRFLPDMIGGVPAHDHLNAVEDHRPEIIGRIDLRTDIAPPVWRWRIDYAGQRAAASGAAFTLANAKAALNFAWRGYQGAMTRSVDMA